MRFGRRRMIAGIEGLTGETCDDAVAVRSSRFLPNFLAVGAGYLASGLVRRAGFVDELWAETALGIAAFVAVAGPGLLLAVRIRVLGLCGDQVVVAKAKRLSGLPSEIEARHETPVRYGKGTFNMVHFDGESWQVAWGRLGRFERIMRGHRGDLDRLRQA